MNAAKGNGFRRVLVVGTGSALVHALHMNEPHAEFTILTNRSLRGMPRQVSWAIVAPGSAWSAALPCAEHAVVQFGAQRKAREAVFWQPSRAELLLVAAALRGQGVRMLEVLLADGSALESSELSQLRRIAFDRVTECRSGAVRMEAANSWPERLVTWMFEVVLSTMRQVAASRR